jgi:hypothetical protein
MQTKFVSYLLAGSLIVLAAWLVQRPIHAQADGLPEKYRATVDKALAYLIKQQHADGHWEGDGGQHPVAMTGLVGLALVMESNNQVTGGDLQRVIVAKHAAQIRKAADWLLEKAQGERDGLLFSGHASETTRYMEGHGLATLFLAGAVTAESDGARRKKLGDALNRAVKYIVKARSSQGGWYHTSKVEGHDFADPLVTVIQFQALLAAGRASILVPDEIARDAYEYLRGRLAPNKKKAPAEPNRPQILETAAALVVRTQLTAIGFPANDTLPGELLKMCADGIPRGRALQFGRDELAHHYYAQALYLTQGAPWTSYRTEMFDHLQSTQKPDGSWPAASGLGVGPVYATALWCTLLQLDRNSHPTTQRHDLLNVN